MRARAVLAGGLALAAGGAATPPAFDPDEGGLRLRPALAAGAAPIPSPWGLAGHEMAARAAVGALPPSVPAFFREAGDQLVYLNPEPDRWRVQESRELNEAFAYDHYIDIENVPKDALDAPDRFAYLRALYEAGLDRPERDAGFLPYRIVEIHQRLASLWRRWRSETDPVRRTWLEQRIVNDAGILGHYVTDASQPHHTTIHFNGWNARVPNPEGYTRDDDFHARFEGRFVKAYVTDADLESRMRGRAAGWIAEQAALAAADVPQAVRDHIAAAHAEVEALYRLERDAGFDPQHPVQEAALDFAARRLAAGADMLAVLWLAAWEGSAEEVDRAGPR